MVRTRRSRRGRAAAVVGEGLAAIAALLLSAFAAFAQYSGAPEVPASGATLLGLPQTVAPLEAEGPWGSAIRLEVFNRLRGEFVDWFAPPPDSPTPNYRYNFIGNKLQIGVRVSKQPYQVFVQYQDTSLGNVPSNAVGPGGIYFANTHAATQNGAILRNAWASTTQVLGVDGLFLKGGRQLYLEGLDAPASTPALKWLQANRISQRLIGPFDYTHVGRSFDGGQLGYDSAKLNLTLFGFRPTYGGYEIDANRELAIDVAGAALNLKETPELGATIGRLFWLYYHDYRDVTYVDNRPLAVRVAATGRSATLHTVGANLAHVEAIGPGAADGMAYGYGQLGDWQGQRQSSWAYGVEAGYRLTTVPWSPWMRVGINSASGDPDPDDDAHQTFFQMLPTAWIYAPFPFYNMMNDQDVFAQCIVDPDPRVSVRLDFHWLRVNSGQDLAYFGGGATKDDFYGFGGVPADGRHELAYLLFALFTVRPLDWLTFNALYAHAFGQGVIDQNFVGRQGNYGYLETIVAF